MKKQSINFVYLSKVQGFTLIEMLFTLFLTSSLLYLAPLLIKSSTYFLNQVNEHYSVEYEFFTLNFHMDQNFKNVTYQLINDKTIEIHKENSTVLLKYNNRKIYLDFKTKGNIILLNNVQKASFTQLSNKIIRLNIIVGDSHTSYEKVLYL